MSDKFQCIEQFGQVSLATEFLGRKKMPKSMSLAHSLYFIREGGGYLEEESTVSFLMPLKVMISSESNLKVYFSE